MLMIDRRLRHVGRLKRVSGTDDPALFAAINARILELQERGALRTLRALKDGTVHPLSILKSDIEVSPASLLKAQKRKPQVVYFVLREDTNELKVGISNNLAKRMVVLQNASGGPIRLLGTMKGGIEQERWLHIQWRRHHKRGEWFHSTPEILAWIKEHARKSSHGTRRVSSPSVLEGETKR